MVKLGRRKNPKKNGRKAKVIPERRRGRRRMTNNSVDKNNQDNGNVKSIIDELFEVEAEMDAKRALETSNGTTINTKTGNGKSIIDELFEVEAEMDAKRVLKTSCNRNRVGRVKKNN
jgi:hypothetical protein